MRSSGFEIGESTTGWLLSVGSGPGGGVWLREINILAGGWWWCQYGHSGPGQQSAEQSPRERQ